MNLNPQVQIKQDSIRPVFWGWSIQAMPGLEKIMTVGFGVRWSRLDICLAAYKSCDLGPSSYLCIGFLTLERGKILCTYVFYG